MEIAEFFSGRTVYCYRTNDENKAAFKRNGNGADVGRFWRDFDLAYNRRNSIAFDLYDPISNGKISAALGCAGTLHLHLHLTYNNPPYTI